MNADPLDYLTADMAADAPVTTDGPDGRVTVSGAVWEDSDVLYHVRREADEARRLFGDVDLGGEDD